jgi:2,3-bisphosphoglycerate-dependent phosphoglycerate mutase
MARVLLIRHCESTGQGTDSPLTDKGRQQAEMLAVWLQRYEVDRIVVSQYQRTLDTILPFAKAGGLEIEVDERTGERRLRDGRFANDEEWLAGVRASIEDPELRFEGGETGRETLARGWAALRELLGAPNAMTAVVCHGQMSTHLLRNVDPSFGFERWRAMTNPDVFLIEAASEVGALRFERVWDPSLSLRAIADQ